MKKVVEERRKYLNGLLNVKELVWRLGKCSGLNTGVGREEIKSV